MGWKMIPSTPGQNQSRQYLMDLINRSVQYPVRDVQDITPIQLLLQQQLSNLVPGMAGNYQLATDEYKKILEGDYDPRTSDYYKGFRQTAEDLRKSSNTAIRQRANMMGMLQSSPAEAVEAENNRKINSMILQELGRMYELERAKRLDAAGNIQSIDSQNLGNIAAASSIADLPRSIEQEKTDAAYEAAIQTLLHPYQYQSALAQMIIQEPRYIYKSKSGSSGIGGALGNLGASFLGTETGAKWLTGLFK